MRGSANTLINRSARAHDLMEALVVDAEYEKQPSDETYDVVEHYESIMADYVFKMTIATVLFFATFPWAAMFWPPYYYRSWDE